MAGFLWLTNLIGSQLATQSAAALRIAPLREPSREAGRANEESN